MSKFPTLSHLAARFSGVSPCSGGKSDRKGVVVEGSTVAQSEACMQQSRSFRESSYCTSSDGLEDTNVSRMQLLFFYQIDQQNDLRAYNRQEDRLRNLVRR